MNKKGCVYISVISGFEFYCSCSPCNCERDVLCSRCGKAVAAQGWCRMRSGLRRQLLPNLVRSQKWSIDKESDEWRFGTVMYAHQCSEFMSEVGGTEMARLPSPWSSTLRSDIRVDRNVITERWRKKQSQFWKTRLWLTTKRHRQRAPVQQGVCEVHAKAANSRFEKNKQNTYVFMHIQNIYSAEGSGFQIKTYHHYSRGSAFVHVSREAGIFTRLKWRHVARLNRVVTCQSPLMPLVTMLSTYMTMGTMLTTSTAIFNFQFVTPSLFYENSISPGHTDHFTGVLTARFTY